MRLTPWVIWKLDRLTRQGIRQIAPLLDALEVERVEIHPAPVWGRNHFEPERISVVWRW